VLKKDSSAFYYAGLTADIKQVFSTLSVSYADSVQQSKWSGVYASSNYKTIVRANPVSSKLMPGLKGMGLKDAVYLVENMGVKIVPRGKGKVMAQSVQAGSAVTKGMVVYVELGQ
jgi:cell division protein FtsI (penicillin-binding protein 3)